jgi:hypothetical protein
MNLIQEILNAQGGNVVKQLGDQFGMDKSQVEKALTNLIPAIAGGVKQTAKSPSSIDALLRKLQQDQDLKNAIERPEVLAKSSSQSAGNEILGEIFGSKDVSRTVASQTAKSTGLDLSALKKMLPLIAGLVMSSLNQKGQASSGGLGELLGGLTKTSSTRGGLGGGIGSVLGNLLGGRAKQSQSSQGIESLLDFDGDGSVSDDVMDLVKKLF